MDATLLEGISGMWHYHVGRSGKAVCGQRLVMRTSARLDSWGFKPGHMPTSYCATCDHVYRVEKDLAEEVGAR